MEGREPKQVFPTPVGGSNENTAREPGEALESTTTSGVELVRYMAARLPWVNRTHDDYASLLSV